MCTILAEKVFHCYVVRGTKELLPARTLPNTGVNLISLYLERGRIIESRTVVNTVQHLEACNFFSDS